MAPSSTLDEKSFNAVVGALLQQEGDDSVIAEFADIWKLMFATSYQPPQASRLDPATSTETPNPDVVTDITTVFMEKMLHLREKEACGSPLLGVLRVYLAKQLHIKMPENNFKVEMEFPLIIEKIKRGSKPSCDGTVCVFLPSIPAQEPRYH